MFNLFRSQKKTVKYFLTFLLGMVAISMVITFIPGLFSTPTTQLAEPVLVEVGDGAVTIFDVQAVMNEYARAGTPGDSMAFMARQVIDNQIEDKILLEEAQNIGIRPSEAELAEWIRDQMPGLFPEGKFVGEATYGQLISSRFQKSIEQFELELLKDLTIEMRLKQLVTDNIVMTEDELKEAYQERNEETRIEYVLLDPNKYLSQVQTDEEKLKAYFESNTFRYRVPATLNFSVITLTAGETEPPEFSEAQIQNFYNQNQYRFETPERVMARHILIMSGDPDTGEPLPDDQMAQAEAKAKEVLEKVRAGGDFVELASEYSEDPGTKDRGGDLGWITRGQTDADFETAAFALQPGDTSDVVKATYGFHIIKSEKKDRAQRKRVDEVRGEIITDLTVEHEQIAQIERADGIMRSLRAPDAAVQSIAAEYKLPIDNYDGISRQAPPIELTGTPQFIGSIFAAQLGETVTHQDEQRTLIGVVRDQVQGRDATFDEVRAKVQADYVNAEARKIADARAAELVAKAKEVDGNLRSAAASYGLTPDTSGFFNRRGEVEGFTGASTLGDTAFTAEPGSVHGPITAGDKIGVYRVVEHREADVTEFLNQRDSIRAMFLQAKQDEMFNLYKASVRKRYEEEGRVTRREDRISEFLRQLARS